MDTGAQTAADPRATAELLRLLLADARLPTGAHAFSGSLEPALLAGQLRPEQIPGYQRTRLLTVVAAEAAAAVLVARAPNRSTVDAVETELAARTPAPAQRRTAAFLGRALLRLARTLPHALAPEALDPQVCGPRPHRGVALGLIAAAWDLEETALVTALCYEDAQTVAAAALKLEPMDPAVPPAWILRLAPTVTHVVRTTLAVRDPEDIPALAAPMIDHWAQTHDRRDRRLFRA